MDSLLNQELSSLFSSFNDIDKSYDTLLEEGMWYRIMIKPLEALISGDLLSIKFCKFFFCRGLWNAGKSLLAKSIFSSFSEGLQYLYILHYTKVGVKGGGQKNIFHLDKIYPYMKKT